MNVLLITEAFPPAPVVGSFRAYKVAQAFRSEGHTVHVLTMRGGGADEVGAGEYEQGITWERVNPWPGPKQLYSAMKSPFKFFREGDSSGVAAGTRSADEAPVGRRGLRSALAALITLPDDRQGLVPAVARPAWSRRGWADLVYATAPSFSVLMAGKLAHHIMGAPWFAELRDPWVGNAGRNTHTISSLVTRLDSWLEMKSLAQTSGIVLVSPKAAEEYGKRYESGNVPILCALNGIDSVVDRRPAHKGGDALRIVYAGSVYPPRDPAPLVKALTQAAAELSSVRVRFTFVGSDDWTEAPQLERAVKELPDSVQVERLSWLPQADARSIVQGADLLLLPAQRWVLQIPDKLYDYLGSRVPIFAAVEPGSDAETMLARAGGHFSVHADAPEMDWHSTAAAALAAAAVRQSAGEVSVLNKWTTAVQMSQLVRSIEQIARGGGAASADRPDDDAAIAASARATR